MPLAESSRRHAASFSTWPSVKLPADLRVTIGPSDVVQETAVDLQRDFGKFTGTTTEECFAWLREVICHNVVDAIRRYRDALRWEAGRETSLTGCRSTEVRGFGALPRMPDGSAIRREEASVINASPLEPRAAAGLVRALAGTVAYAHAAGVVHRDIKPGNVLLSPVTTGVESTSPASAGTGGSGLSVKLADFGLGKLEEESDLVDPLTQLTRTGTSIGTPAWMAPEQIDRSFGAIGPVTDVHALWGCSSTAS